MAQKKSKYLIWLETLHREYTDRTNITLFGQQAAFIRLLGDMYEVRCRFERIFEKMRKEAVMLDDEGLDYQEWINPEKWKCTESLLVDEDIRETFGFSQDSPLAQTYANKLLEPFDKNATFNTDNFRNVVSSLFIFNQIVDTQRMEVAINNELKKLQEALLNIFNAKQKTLSNEDYANYYKKALISYRDGFLTKNMLDIKHKQWKDSITEDLNMEVLNERRVKLLLDFFDTGFADELKKEHHRRPKEDTLHFKDYDFDNWNDRMDDAVKYFDALSTICPFKDDMIDFSRHEKLGKYMLLHHIEPAMQGTFFECMELIRKVQAEMRQLENPDDMGEEGDSIVELFVERVKRIMLKAEDDNGTMKENNSRKQPVQYKYNVDGKGFCEVMNDLLLTHEKELSDYLDGATIETAVSIKYVAPFVGFVLDTHLYTPEMMPKNTFTEAFKFVYGENTSAVAKMSDKNPSEEAKKLFAVTREIMEKHKQA